MGTPDPPPEWLAWMEQAEHDIAGARSSHSRGFWDHAVMLAEQAAEKATKAVWIAARETLPPRTHAVGKLLQQLGAPGLLVKAGTALADGYFSVRYPPVEGPAPFANIGADDAETAIGDAERIMQWAKEQLPHVQT